MKTTKSGFNDWTISPPKTTYDGSLVKPSLVQVSVSFNAEGEYEYSRSRMTYPPPALMSHSHFPGSSILYWDRLDEPKPSSDDLPTKPTPVSGIIFTADTMMVQPTRLGFTFMWSVPNMVSRFRSQVYSNIRIQTRVLIRYGVDPTPTSRCFENTQAGRTLVVQSSNVHLAR